MRLNKKEISFKVLRVLTALSFMSGTLGLDMLRPRLASAEPLNLPPINQFIGLSESYSFPVLKGLRFAPDNPLTLEFIVDTANQKNISEKEASTLIKYFLAALTIPEEEIWVNLSPYEQDRVIPENLGQTDLGKGLLSQDYVLKQLTSSLTYPESDTGKDYWERTYAEVLKIAKTTNLPVNTFNKIWIVPDRAQVYENENIAVIAEATLKAMLEEDYLALQNKAADIRKEKKNLDNDTIEKINKAASEVMKETILARINRDINSGKNFAALRQIYHSLILGIWFKKKFQDSLYAHYINKGKIKGIDLEDKAIKEKIYKHYVQAFKNGLYNYVKSDYEPGSKKKLKRRYYSGGFSLVGDESGSFNLGIITKPLSFIASLFRIDIKGKAKSLVVRLEGYNPEERGPAASSPLQEPPDAAREGLSLQRNTRFKIGYEPLPHYFPPAGLTTEVTAVVAAMLTKEGWRGRARGLDKNDPQQKKEIEDIKIKADGFAKDVAEKIIKKKDIVVITGSSEGERDEVAESFKAGEIIAREEIKAIINTFREEGLSVREIIERLKERGIEVKYGVFDVIEGTTATVFNLEDKALADLPSWQSGGTSIFALADIGYLDTLGYIPDFYADAIFSSVPEDKVPEFRENPLDPEDTAAGEGISVDDLAEKIEKQLGRIAKANNIGIGDLEVVDMDRIRAKQRQEALKLLQQKYPGLELVKIPDGTVAHALLANFGRKEGKHKVFLGVGAAPEGTYNLINAILLREQGAIASLRIYSKNVEKIGKNTGDLRARYSFSEEEKLKIASRDDRELIEKGKLLFTQWAIYERENGSLVKLKDLSGGIELSMAFITPNGVFGQEGVGEGEGRRYQGNVLRIENIQGRPSIWPERATVDAEKRALVETASSALVANAQSVPELVAGLSGSLTITREEGVKIKDEGRFREILPEIAKAAALSKNPEVKVTAQWILEVIARERGIVPNSMSLVYAQMAQKDSPLPRFTVPAFNIRTFSLESIRRIIRTAKNLKAGAFIIQLAISEKGYTAQPPAEFKAIVMAAAIMEGYSGPIFLQADHYQKKAESYVKDIDKTREKSFKEIKEAVIEGSYFGIDSDNSTLVPSSDVIEDLEAEIVKKADDKKATQLEIQKKLLEYADKIFANWSRNIRIEEIIAKVGATLTRYHQQGFYTRIIEETKQKLTQETEPKKREPLEKLKATIERFVQRIEAAPLELAQEIVKSQIINAQETAIDTLLVRALEPEGLSITVGGEIGEVGGKNSEPAEFVAFLEFYNAILKFMRGEIVSVREGDIFDIVMSKKIWAQEILVRLKNKYAAADVKGLSTVAIQTGTAHGVGGLIDFNTMSTLAELAKEYQVGVVQHGASMLPEEQFNLIRENGAARVHLATKFMEIVLEDLKAHHPDIFQILKDDTIKRLGGEPKKIADYRNSLALIKEAVYNLPKESQERIADKLERVFSVIMKNLGVENTKELVEKIIPSRSVALPPRPEALEKVFASASTDISSEGKSQKASSALSQQKAGIGDLKSLLQQYGGKELENGIWYFPNAQERDNFLSASGIELSTDKRIDLLIAGLPYEVLVQAAGVQGETPVAAASPLESREGKDVYHKFPDGVYGEGSMQDAGDDVYWNFVDERSKDKWGVGDWIGKMVENDGRVLQPVPRILYQIEHHHGRERFIGVNWHTDIKTTEDVKGLTERILSELSQKDLDPKTMEIVIPVAASFVHFEAVSKVLKASSIPEGLVRLMSQAVAEDEHAVPSGSVTAKQLADLGVEYALVTDFEEKKIGHVKVNSPERSAHRKVHQILGQKGMRPIIIVGETQEERDEGQAYQVIANQVLKSIYGSHVYMDSTRIVIAYRPDYREIVKSTGKKLTAEKKVEMLKKMQLFIRALIFKEYGYDVASRISILYSLMAEEEEPEVTGQVIVRSGMDGVLVRGAGHYISTMRPEEFIKGMVEILRKKNVSSGPAEESATTASSAITTIAQRINPKQGAFTGQVSLEGAIKAGAKGVIVGHSEARRYFVGEDEQINEQVLAALPREEIGTVILCVGDQGKDKKEGRSKEVVIAQLQEGLRNAPIELVERKLKIAYEPVYSIKGSPDYVGAANPEDAEGMQQTITQTLVELFSDVGKSINILYGGSVDSVNARDYLAVDYGGLLVGTASTKKEEILKIIKIAETFGREEGRKFYIGGNLKTYPLDTSLEEYVRALKALDSENVEIGIAPSQENIGDFARAFSASPIKSSDGSPAVLASLGHIVPAGNRDWTKGGIDMQGIDVGTTPSSSPIKFAPGFDARNFSGFIFKIVAMREINDFDSLVSPPQR